MNLLEIGKSLMIMEIIGRRLDFLQGEKRVMMAKTVILAWPQVFVLAL